MKKRTKFARGYVWPGDRIEVLFTTLGRDAWLAAEVTAVYATDFRARAFVGGEWRENIVCLVGREGKFWKRVRGGRVK